MKLKFTLLLLFVFVSLFAQMPNTLSKADKIYGLSKFWQEVNYNFVYLDKVNREMWDSTYKALITEVQDTKDDYEYFRLLQKFCALLKDGHTNVYFPKAVEKLVYNTFFGDYRLFLTNIDGRTIVTRVNLSKKDEIPIGTEVVKVNGLKTKDYAAKYVIPYISSSTDYIVENRAASKLFSAPVGTSFDVVFRLPDGKKKKMKLTHAETTEKEVYPPFEKRTFLDFKWLEEDIAYVSLNTFSIRKINELFEAKLPELSRAKALVIDLRKNGGGSTGVGLDILSHLTNDTLLYGSLNSSRLHIPSFKAWGTWTAAKDTVGNAWATQEYLSYRDQYFHFFPYAPDTARVADFPKRIVVPTAILIGNNTASAAEDFLIYADNQAHMTKIGSPTFGSTGQPFLFQLPGGANARICTKKDTYPDGKEFVGYGVQPDILVKKTYEDYLQNRDPVLERALEHLKKEK